MSFRAEFSFVFLEHIFFFFFATVMFFQMILSGVEFGICSFWTYLKMACFPLANDYLFLWKKDKIFFFFFGSNSALQKGLQTERRKCRRTNFPLCLTQNILLKLRVAPSTKVNICAKGTMPDAILRHPQFTLFPFESLKHKSFTLWNLASRGKEVNIRKYTLEKVQDFFADNLLLIS